MGEVFLADDTQLERKVAIKFLPEALQHDPVARGRFEREAKSAAALDHPFICKIYEFAKVDGRAAIVMEHVVGQTLESRLAEGPLAQAQAIQIAAEMAEALTEAHARRILHRDLKPANLMLTEQGHVKVMDFGLAKRMRDPGGSDSQDLTQGSLTQTGALLGTPAYMSPEQVRGEPVDVRSDIFSFGVVLFELLTGEHPFKRGTVSDTIAAILRDPPSRADGSGDPIDYAIFDKLLAKTPADRYQSFEAVSVEVRRLRDVTFGWTEPVSAVADASAPPLGGRRTPFIGRDSEHAELGRWLDQAVRGRGGLVLIGGEPGVGKTRLAEEVLGDARQRGCLALTGRCYEMAGTPPFIPWVEMVERAASIMPRATFRDALGDAAPEVAKLVPELRRMFPDIPPPIELPPEQQRRYLFNSFLDFVKRGTRVSPQVLLIDDLHWADDSTLLLLQHVAQHVAQLPLLIVGTYRDVDLDVARPFAKTLEALTRQRLAHKVTLRRLPETGVGDMLEALSGQAPPAGRDRDRRGGVARRHAVARTAAQLQRSHLLYVDGWTRVGDGGRAVGSAAARLRRRLGLGAGGRLARHGPLVCGRRGVGRGGTGSGGDGRASRRVGGHGHHQDVAGGERAEPARRLRGVRTVRSLVHRLQRAERLSVDARRRLLARSDQFLAWAVGRGAVTHRAVARVRATDAASHDRL